MFSQPLGNWRRVSVRERKTCLDFAEEIAHLLDVDFPDARKVVLVMDNLSHAVWGAIRLVRLTSDFRRTRRGNM
jgi:hypothetical protein